MAACSDASLDTMVGNFETMLTPLTYLGAGYNPDPAILKLPALQTQVAGARSGSALNSGSRHKMG